MAGLVAPSPQGLYKNGVAVGAAEGEAEGEAVGAVGAADGAAVGGLGVLAGAGGWPTTSDTITYSVTTRKEKPLRMNTTIAFIVSI